MQGRTNLTVEIIDGKDIGPACHVNRIGNQESTKNERLLGQSFDRDISFGFLLESLQSCFAPVWSQKPSDA